MNFPSVLSISFLCAISQQFPTDAFKLPSFKRSPLAVHAVATTPIRRQFNRSPVLTVVDPLTGNNIHLVGVSHGSAVSAQLVNDVIDDINPAAVVLELCDDRFWSISLDSKVRPRGNATLAEAFDNKIALLESKQQQQKETTFNANFPIVGAFSQTLKFASGQGLVGGMFVLLGLFVSNLQRMVRSNTGGDEFVTAMLAAERLDIPVRLGDAPQNDTLDSIRHGVISKEAFSPSCIRQGALFLAFSAFGIAAEKSNQRLASVIPDSALKSSEWVSIPGTYAENASMLKSLMPLFATLLLTTTISYFPYEIFGAADIPAAGDAATATAANSLLALFTYQPPPEVEYTVSSIFDVLSALILIRMTKVIGTDRDCIIAKNVQTTAAEFPGKDIVVVIGMLHCNGVARWLLSGVDPLKFNAETTDAQT
jgi:hypothetical protein